MIGFLISAAVGWLLAMIVRTEDDADPEPWEWDEDEEGEPGNSGVSGGAGDGA